MYLLTFYVDKLGPDSAAGEARGPIIRISDSNIHFYV
jgi:hypothetical protein